MNVNKPQSKLHYLLLIPVALFFFGVIDMIVLFFMSMQDMVSQTESSPMVFNLIDLSALTSIISFSLFLIFNVFTHKAPQQESC